MKIKNIKWRSLFIQLILLVAIFYLVSWYQQRNIVKGKAPEIADRLITGQPVRLSDFAGKPVLLHFWATWCPVCKLENDNIDSLAKKIPVLTIASWSEGAENVAKFMADENLSMPVIVDDEGVWAKLYGVKAVPSSFLIDGKGEIRFIQTGYNTELGLALRLWWLENN